MQEYQETSPSRSDFIFDFTFNGKEECKRKSSSVPNLLRATSTIRECYSLNYSQHRDILLDVLPLQKGIRMIVG